MNILRKLNGWRLGLWACIAILFGVIATKIIEHQLLASGLFIQILTVFVLIVLCVLIWIAGWSARPKE